MRVLVVMCAYNEEDFVVRNIQTLYPYVDKIAISTSNHLTGEDSDDKTRLLVEEFKTYIDKENKVLLSPLEKILSTSLGFDAEEGFVKTELMNVMEPEDGDWIWVVDADEFYSERHLELLRSRYVLNHQALNKFNHHCVMMQSMVFAYNCHRFYWSRHGRIFRYKKGSYFSKVNHFVWPDGTKIYGDLYGWDMPPTYMYMYHMRYVRKNIERLRNRYIYRKDHAGERKLGWFDNVFMKYPKSPNQALRTNKIMFGANGFDGVNSGDLKHIVDPDLPQCLKSLNYNLWDILCNGGSK